MRRAGKRVGKLRGRSLAVKRHGAVRTARAESVGSRPFQQRTAVDMQQGNEA
jgi:hypothetical protein